MLDLLKKPPVAAAASTTADAAPATEPSGIVYAPLRKIADNPYQPRGHYDAEHILNLSLSIKRLKGELPATRGLQQLPMARLGFREPNGATKLASRSFYGGGRANRLIVTDARAIVELMFGHSRLRAFMLLAEGLHTLRDGSAIGLDLRGVSEMESRFAELMDADLDYVEMPLMLGFALDHQMWQHAITENSQRRNITAIEEAQSIERAIAEFGLTTEQAGKPFGYARSTTANKLRLLALPAEVKAAIGRGDLTERHGRELVRLAGDPDRASKIAALAIKKGLTVRQLTENVNWEEKELRRAQTKMQELAAARAALTAGWTLPGQTATLPADRIVDHESWQASSFDANDAEHRALFEHGYCGVQCACLGVAFSEYRGPRGFRPDPESAPNCCLVCTDHNERLGKTNAMRAAGLSEADQERQRAIAERQRQVEELNDAAQARWQQWLKEQDRHALWNSLPFWREVKTSLRFWRLEAVFEDVFEDAEDIQAACVNVLGYMYDSTRSLDDSLNQSVHKVELVEALIDRLEGVSRETEEAGNGYDT